MIPFSPLDLNVSAWFRPLPDRIEFHPAPNDARVAALHPFGAPKGTQFATFPLRSWDHSDTPPTFSHAPFYGNSGVDLLNGRPTIRFERGTYLNGTTYDWSNLFSSSAFNNPRTDNEQPGYIESMLWDPSNHHMFCLCRVLPPTEPVTSQKYQEAGSYESYTGGFLNPRRPVIIGTYGGAGWWPAIHLWNWPTSGLSGGQLRLFSWMDPPIRDKGFSYNYRHPYVATVPFSLGEWALLEWSIDPTDLVTRPRDPQTGAGSGASTGGPDLMQRVKFWLNGAQVGGDLYREATYYYDNSDPYYAGTIDHSQMRDASNFSLFAESPGEGDRADLSTTGCKGNLAELMLFPRALTSDEAAKVRAYIMQRHGLESLLPAGAPYRHAGFIPGSDPVTTTTFPGLTASSRSFTPGTYPATPFTSTAGVERQVRHSSTGYAGDRLNLTFNALSEGDTQLIIEHYERTRGGYEPFGLRPETLLNLSPVAAHLGRAITRDDLRPVGASWSYAQPPEVTTIRENVNNVTVELELLRRAPVIPITVTEPSVTTTSGGAISVQA